MPQRRLFQGVKVNGVNVGSLLGGSTYGDGSANPV